MDRIWKTALIAAAILVISQAGCVVDEDSSVIMLGSVIGSASVETTDAPEGEAEGIDVRCEFPLEFDEPHVWSRGVINLEQLGTTGQPVVSSVPQSGFPDRYLFRAVFENRLLDSRSVGAVSGGSGGGFEGMDLDKNDIIITSATVGFPAESNTFNVGDATVTFEGFERDRLTSMLVQSGSGVASMDVPLINGSGERQAFEEFITDGMGLDADTMVTFVVEIQLQGHTLGGTDVESNRYAFPIEMCLDCDVGINPQCQEG